MLLLFIYNFYLQGGTGPVLITPVNAKIPLCEYNIIWRTGHACANNDVITTECQFSNGEVSFDLTKLEKPKKQMSYGVTEGDYEYRIKVCSNGQPCGMLSRVALTHYDMVLSRVCVAAGSCF